MQVFFDVHPECQEGVKNFYLRIYPFFGEFAVENFEDKGENRRKKLFQLGVQSFPESFDERDNWKLQGRAFP